MTQTSALWLLPDGVEELLPADAVRIESLRRRLLDLYASWSYQLVVPPLVEFLDALLTGAGQDLELQTFKLTDLESGRMMGVRADMTPQVARIDSRIHHQGVANRLCYIGSVLRTRARNQLASRTPVQSGAELFGEAGVEADIEILSLMLEVLEVAGVANVHLDLSHVAIVRRLLARSGLDSEGCARLSDAWRRKAVPEVDAIAEEITDAQIAHQVRRLPRSMSGLDALDTLFATFGGDAVIDRSLLEMKHVASVLQERFPEVEICFDLCEMRGYHYHTGLFFAAYTPGLGQAVAEGGRYDGVGAHFGESRAATGFSVDLRALLRCEGRSELPAGMAILAPRIDDADLWHMARKLRREGEMVRFAMPGESEEGQRKACDRRLQQIDGQWRVEPW